MKLYELAKELNVKSKVLIDMLNEMVESDKKFVATTNLTDEQIEILKADINIEKEEKQEEAKKEIKTDADYRPQEMIPCHSVFPGILHFTGIHTGITYDFVGVGDRRNIEYQDLRAAMLNGYSSIMNPDIIIDDENIVNDEVWYRVKDVYSKMFNEAEIKKVLDLPTRDFKVAFERLPVTAKNTIITIIASQIDDGTFEQYNKAKIIDEICGTRFDLKM